MAWTNPKTINVGDLGTAADWNTHVRDNLLFLYTGGPMHYAYVATQQGTSTTTYTDLTTVGPAVTVDVAGVYEIEVGCQASRSGNNTPDTVFMSYSSASIGAATDAVGAAANLGGWWSVRSPVVRHTLAAGETVTAKYRHGDASGGTSQWRARFIRARLVG